MEAKALHSRIVQFLKTYGKNPPKTSEVRSLDMISDFMLIIGCEAKIRFVPIIKKKRKKPMGGA